jgi:hypothetical protein
LYLGACTSSLGCCALIVAQRAALPDLHHN